MPASGTRAIAAASIVSAASPRSQVVHVGLAAGARDRLRLQHHRPQVVGEAPAAQLRVEARSEAVVLGRDAGRILPLVPVVVVTGRHAEVGVAVLELPGELSPSAMIHHHTNQHYVSAQPCFCNTLLNFSILFINAIEFGHGEVKKIIAAIEELVAKSGKPKRPLLS